MKVIVEQYVAAVVLPVALGVLALLTFVAADRKLHAEPIPSPRTAHAAAAPGPCAASRPLPARPPAGPITATPSAVAQAFQAVQMLPLRSAQAETPVPTGTVRPQAQPYVVRRMRVTAYCPCTECCGSGAHGVTANGTRIWNTDGRFVAADRTIAFGTRIVVPGYAAGCEVPVLDRGGRVKAGCIDVYFADHRTAKQWGVRWLDVKIYLGK